MNWVCIGLGDIAHLMDGNLTRCGIRPGAMIKAEAYNKRCQRCVKLDALDAEKETDWEE